MATKTTTKTAPEETPEVKETVTAPDPWERVPYKLPLTRELAKTDPIHFVSLNDYTANIKRGELVYIPRCVAEMLDRQQEDEDEAIRISMGLQDEYEKKADMYL